MRIRDVEQQTGLNRNTIRFYEAKGLLRPERSDNFYREYDEEVVKQLKRIAVLRKAGISIADIQLWQDNVISSEEMLHKRLSELRSAADIAMDQVKLCNDLLAGKPVDLQRNPSASAEDPDMTSEASEYVPVLPCIGLDIGTTTISAVVLDVAAGKTAGVYTLANASDLPSDFAWEKMQNVERIVDRVHKLLDSLLRRYTGVKTIGITGQMHGILYVDADGNAISPLYTWQDGRAGLGSPSPCQILEERTGYRLAPGYGLATHFANVLNKNVPENAVKLCTIMDYIVMKLTDRTCPLMHSSDAASLGFYNTQTNTFDTDAFLRAGIDPAVLPDVTAESTIAGTWNGIPVTAAIGDNQASFLGSVQKPEHEALANFGTGSQISVMNCDTSGFQPDAAMEIRPFLENSWLTSGSALCGGRAYALLERFFRQYVTACGMSATEQYEVMNVLAKKGIESGKYLHVHTTFCGTRNAPSLCGSIDGISEELLTPEALIAGTLWGMATELHDMFLQMPHNHVNKLVISGNAVRKNPALRQMLKEVFAMDVCMPIHKEEAAFGAAMFAAMGSGCAGRDALAACIRYSGI